MTTRAYGNQPASVTNLNATERLNVIPELFPAQPAKTPFLAWLLSMGVVQMPDWKSFHFTKDFVPLFTQVNNGAGYDAATQPITVDDATIFRANDVVRCFNSGEEMRFITASSATVAVFGRNVGGTTYTLADNDYLIRIAPGSRHGEAIGQWATQASVAVYHYIQEMEKVVRTNRENRGVNMVAAPRREQEQAEKQAEFWTDAERALMLNAQPGEYTSGYGYTGLSGADVGAAASTEHPLYYSNSIEAVASTHKTTYYSGGARQTISESDFNIWCGAHVHAEAPGILMPVFVSANFRKCLNYWGREKLQTRPSDLVIGINVQAYQADSGPVEFVDVPQLKDVYSGIGWNGAAFAVVPGKALIGSIAEQGIKLELDVVKDGTRQDVDRWLGSYGLVHEHEKYVTWTDGVSGPTTS